MNINKTKKGNTMNRSIITNLYDPEKELTLSDYVSIPCLYGYSKQELNMLYENIRKAYQKALFGNETELKTRLYTDCIDLSGYIVRY